MPAEFSSLPGTWVSADTAERQGVLELTSSAQLCIPVAAEAQDQKRVTFVCSASVPKLAIYQSACRHVNMFYLLKAPAGSLGQNKTKPIFFKIAP